MLACMDSLGRPLNGRNLDVLGGHLNHTQHITIDSPKLTPRLTPDPRASTSFMIRRWWVRTFLRSISATPVSAMILRMVSPPRPTIIPTASNGTCRTTANHKSEFFISLGTRNLLVICNQDSKQYYYTRAVAILLTWNSRDSSGPTVTGADREGGGTKGEAVAALFSLASSVVSCFSI